MPIKASLGLPAEPDPEPVVEIPIAPRVPAPPKPVIETKPEEEIQLPLIVRPPSSSPKIKIDVVGEESPIPEEIAAEETGAWLEPPEGLDVLPEPAETPAESPAEIIQTQGKNLYYPNVELEIPGSQVLFRLESEQALRGRMQQEIWGRKGGKARGPLEFPEETIPLSRPEIAAKPGMPRPWEPKAELVEPNYLAYRRLYFQQINAEKYGWDYGFLHPFISAGTFYFDVLTLPFQFVAEPFRRYEYNTGYCLPGDPVPLLLYPPRPK